MKRELGQRILVLDEKHGRWYFDAATDEEAA